MANSQNTTSLIAKSSLAILTNELGFLTDVHRPYEDEFDKKVNGYTPGESISITRPAEFTVRSGAVASVQDVKEGKVTLSVDQQKGIDFRFTSKELTQNIDSLADRVLKPAMVRLANEIASDCLLTWFPFVNNWVGDAGQTINSFADFAVGTQRLNELATPMESRYGVVSPADRSALVGSQTVLNNDQMVRDSYRKGTMGEIDGVMTSMTQLIPSMTTGTRDAGGTCAVDQTLTTSTTTYDAVKDTWVQTLHIDTLTSATATISAGEVFTIADVYEVNPVTKVSTGVLKQFTVTAAATAASNEVDLTITPPLIWSGAQQTVSVASGVSDLDGKIVSFKGTASTAYKQNLLFHKNFATIAMVPMVSPAGAVDVARESQDGISVRLIPYYDGTNDYSNYRLDVLYGRKVIDGRIATRLSGTS